MYFSIFAQLYNISIKNGEKERTSNFKRLIFYIYLFSMDGIDRGPRQNSGAPSS